MKAAALLPSQQRAGRLRRRAKSRSVEETMVFDLLLLALAYLVGAATRARFDRGRRRRRRRRNVARPKLAAVRHLGSGA